MPKPKAKPVDTTPKPTQQQADEMAWELVFRGALVVVNHSGGKDSQAMLAKVRAIVPASQILVIHAELPDVEWEGTEEHARATSAGLAFVTCRAGKTLLGMVEKRGQWPSPQLRQCTSDLKRGPIEKVIRRWITAHGLSGLVVNAMGMRAEESPKRKDLSPWRRREGNETGKGAVREWYDWLPVHSYQRADVFEAIRAAGQEPHWAYAAGMSRLSCVFCIMSSQADLQTAARLKPALFAQYAALETKIGKTVFLGKAPPASEAEREAWREAVRRAKAEGKPRPNKARKPGVPIPITDVVRGRVSLPMLGACGN